MIQPPIPLPPFMRTYATFVFYNRGSAAVFFAWQKLPLSAR